MTIEEFLVELAKIKGWKMGIASPDYNYLGWIRMACVEPRCPISVVVAEKCHNGVHNESDFVNPVDAGILCLGLSGDDAAAIQQASDGNMRHLNYSPKLRKDIERACGLTKE